MNSLFELYQENQETITPFLYAGGFFIAVLVLTKLKRYVVPEPSELCKKICEKLEDTNTSFIRLYSFEVSFFMNNVRIDIDEKDYFNDIWPYTRVFVSGHKVDFCLIDAWRICWKFRKISNRLITTATNNAEDVKQKAVNRALGKIVN